MEQGNNVQLVSPDIADVIKKMSVQEIELALDGIVAATNLQDTYNFQIELAGEIAGGEISGDVTEDSDVVPDFEAVDLFGDQLMVSVDEVDFKHDKNGDPADDAKVYTMTEPAPTFSGGLTKAKDDGGTGPGKDE
jgi:hypothetical protein